MASYKSIFAHKHSFTVGVEEEYMLCHPETGDLVGLADEILEQINPDEQERFSYELIQSEIEINTPVAGTVDEAMAHVGHFRRRVREIGEQVGYRPGISGTHPTALADDQTFVDSEGYQWVAEQLHFYARRNITFAMHVHVALPNGDVTVAVANAARRWLAPLLALSANSPFFHAHNTGMLSSRTFQFGAFPRTNIPATFRSFEHFCEVMDTYTRMGSINQPRQIWWKIRPHGYYGTIEFRVCDAQRSLKRTRMLVALSQAIAHRVAQEYEAGILQQDFELEYLNDALWKATRFGFEARVVEPAGNQIMTMGEHTELMVNYLESSLIELGTADIIPTVEEVVAGGSEARQQLEVFQQGGFALLQKMLMDHVEYDESGEND